MQKGACSHVGNCKVFYVENAKPYSRLGLIVGKKVGHAPARSKWKRRLKESFRLERQGFTHSLDVVVLVRGKSETPSLNELRSMFRCLASNEKPSP
mgnify:CR=1 FL=1|jgi:ribonuclease P protein component